MNDQTGTVYVLNVNPKGTDVIHTRHGDERCNRDQVKGRQLIDPDTAEALVKMGSARGCDHCKPFPDDPLLL